VGVPHLTLIGSAPFVIIAATAFVAIDANPIAVPATTNDSSPSFLPISEAARLIAMSLLRLQGRYACLEVIELLLDFAKFVLNR